MKKILKITLALMMALGLQLTSLNAVNALNIDLSKVGTYQIPIKSLTSAAPLPAVQKAFANAFGDTVEVTVDKDGKMQAVATLQNMVISLFGADNYANVLTISNGTTLSTKVEKSTQGMNGPTVETEVPEKISFELPQLDENNSTVLPITVDFMNALMGNGKDYPTNVTLTLDLENAKVLQKEYVLEDGTYDVPVNVLKENSDDQSMAASAINSKAKIIVKDGKATMYLSTKEMSFGSIKASLQEFYIGSEQADYKNYSATIIEKDTQGNPTLWAFELPHENEYINVMMNPHVAMMGNMDLAARLKIDYTTLTYVSDKTELEPNTKKDDQQENTNKDQTANKENQINENQSVKTGDQTSIQLFMTLFIISITMIGFILRKKHEA